MLRTRRPAHLIAFIAATAISGCGDPPTRVVEPSAANLSAVKFWEANASTRWNERAIALLNLRPPPNGQAAASRVLTYLSLAQYRAVLAAEAAKVKSVHPSVSAAVGGASAEVLRAFFPLDQATIEGQLDADLSAPAWPGANHQDEPAGEAIGRAVGATVMTLASTDNYLPGVSVGVPPVGPGFWVWNGQPIVRSLHGVRPFFLSSPSQLRAPPPPTFGTAAFLAALAEVRSISNSLSAEQLASAQHWAAGFTISSNNQVANELIRRHRRTEREAARILAYANAAAFDAQIACWDSKTHYWFIRPSQADAAVTLSVGLPNHPSYPSGHSCITGAVMSALIDEFPGERSRLNAIIEEAGLSRVYGGIHYRFDIEAGQAIGAGAAALARAGSLE